MEKTQTPPEDFIATLPPDRRADIEQLDAMISEVMAGEPRAMWEGVFWGGSQQNIIGYGEYSYTRAGKTNTWFVIGLALQKNYMSVYVSAVEGGQYVTERYAGRLGKAKVGKSNITFKSLADVNVDALRELLERARELSASPAT